jgi:hypothetical protein
MNWHTNKKQYGKIFFKVIADISFPEDVFLCDKAGLLACVPLLAFPSLTVALKITTVFIAYSCGYSSGFYLKKQIAPDSLFMRSGHSGLQP